MFNQSFYHGTIQKYIDLFGVLFSNIYVARTKDVNEDIQSMKVPISYSPKEKMGVRAEGDPDLNRNISISLPRMGFEIVNYQYDADRKLAQTTKFSMKDCDTNQYKYAYSPVPWNFQFALYILTKNPQDGLQIIEQILPFFGPSFVVTADIFPDICQPFDIPIILNDVNQEDNYEGSFEERRIIKWTLTFTLKGLLLGPIINTAIIKQANVDFRLSKSTPIVVNTAISNSIVISVQGGLDANGDPTTDITESIPYDEIEFDDGHAIIKTITESL